MNKDNLLRKINVALRPLKISVVWNEGYKYQSEISFWEETLAQYQNWYDGKLRILYGEPAPAEKNKITGHDKLQNAVLTWEKIHQQPKYLEDLRLKRSDFSGEKVLDLGSGPHPSGLVFEKSEIFCLDPLLPEYMKLGFPYHLYARRARFVYGFGEKLPFADNSIDTVISVNAIDHVDDFEQTVKEIKRVLKKEGKLRFHIHYHKPSRSEPMELNDARVKSAFAWCNKMKKLSESDTKYGYKLKRPEERYALWSNF